MTGETSSVQAREQGQTGWSARLSHRVCSPTVLFKIRTGAALETRLGPAAVGGPVAARSPFNVVGGEP